MVPEIYEPAEDTFLMEEVLNKEILEGKTVFEMGPGSGYLLREGFFSGDINPLAVSLCKEKGFNCVETNLFSNVSGKFDLIYFNPPYLPLDPREPLSSRTATTGGEKGSEIINDFLLQARGRLNSSGKVLLLTSSLTGGVDFSGWDKKLVGEKKLFMEKLFVWELK